MVDFEVRYIYAVQFLATYVYGLKTVSLFHGNFLQVKLYTPYLE